MTFILKNNVNQLLYSLGDAVLESGLHVLHCPLKIINRNWFNFVLNPCLQLLNGTQNFGCRPLISRSPHNNRSHFVRSNKRMGQGTSLLREITYQKWVAQQESNLIDIILLDWSKNLFNKFLLWLNILEFISVQYLQRWQFDSYFKTTQSICPTL